MTARVPNPLTRAQIAQLGGLARARKTDADLRRMWSARGGNTVVELYGREHMVRLAHKSAGRLKGGHE